MSDVIAMLAAFAPVVAVILAIAVILGVLDHLFSWISDRRGSDDV